MPRVLPLRLGSLALAVAVTTGWPAAGAVEDHHRQLATVASHKSEVLADLKQVSVRLAGELVSVEARTALTAAQAAATDLARALPAAPRPAWAHEPLGDPVPARAGGGEAPPAKDIGLALARERAQVAALLDEIDLEARQLLAEIEMLEAEAAARGTVLAVGRGRGGPPVDVPAAARARTVRAGAESSAVAGAAHEAPEFVWPAEGVTTSEFGHRWGRLHAGIDIAADIGTPIVASSGGVVRFAGWMRGYGVTTIIDHDSATATLYAHQNELFVSEGQRVEQGERIGTVGATGVSTGPHLHFETHVEGVARDPRLVLPPKPGRG